MFVNECDPSDINLYFLYIILHPVSTQAVRRVTDTFLCGLYVRRYQFECIPHCCTLKIVKKKENHSVSRLKKKKGNRRFFTGVDIFSSETLNTVVLLSDYYRNGMC